MNALYTLLWKKVVPGGGAALMLIIAFLIFFGGFWVVAMWTLIPGIVMFVLSLILVNGTMIVVLRGIYLENVHRLNQRCLH